MNKIEIFEPAMCCPTGLCGPGINPELLRISTLINSLTAAGLVINRYNLASIPQNFITNTEVNKLLTNNGVDILPVTMIDGVVVKTHEYPTEGELSKWLDISLKEVTIPAKSSNCNCGGNECS